MPAPVVVVVVVTTVAGGSFLADQSAAVAAAPVAALAAATMARVTLDMVEAGFGLCFGELRRRGRAQRRGDSS
jgi:hypothetical protein